METLYVPSERIWLPDIVLYNNAGRGKKKMSLSVFVICDKFPRWKVRGATYDQSRAQVHRSRKMDAASHLQVVLSGTSHLQVVLSGINHLQVVLSGTSNLQVVLSGTSHLQVIQSGTSHLQVVLSVTKHLQVVLSGTSHLQVVLSGTTIYKSSCQIPCAYRSSPCINQPMIRTRFQVSNIYEYFYQVPSIKYS